MKLLLFFSCQLNKAKRTTTKLIKLPSASIKILVFSSGPPAVLLVANLVEVRQIHPDGNSDVTLVGEPRGSIIALDYDPIQNYVGKHFHLFYLFLLYL